MCGRSRVLGGLNIVRDQQVSAASLQVGINADTVNAGRLVDTLKAVVDVEALYRGAIPGRLVRPHTLQHIHIHDDTDDQRGDVSGLIPASGYDQYPASRIVEQVPYSEGSSNRGLSL